MKKEDIAALAQLLTAMKESAAELSKAYDKKDMENLSEAKREILNFQKEVDKLCK